MSLQREETLNPEYIISGILSLRAQMLEMIYILKAWVTSTCSGIFSTDQDPESHTSLQAVSAGADNPAFSRP